MSQPTTSAQSNQSKTNSTQSMSQPLNQQISRTNTAIRSFANATKQNSNELFPKKNQAIVMDSVDGIKIKDYIIAIGNLTDPKNIIFASRISNNRICIYLRNKEIIDAILRNNNNVKIENNTINIRRLITPAQRIILANVCPTIPHKTIEKELTDSGLKLVSQINFLKAGMQEPEYAHILSFRRQVYINPDSNTPIPDTLIINHEETSYRIFLTEDKMTCLLCKQDGHTAKQCQNSTSQRPSADPTLPRQTIDPTPQRLPTDTSLQKKRPASEPASDLASDLASEPTPDTNPNSNNQVNTTNENDTDNNTNTSQTTKKKQKNQIGKPFRRDTCRRTIKTCEKFH